MVNAVVSEEESDSSSEAMPNVTRKWELFPGNNRFCCDGRIMTAPNAGVFYVTTTLIVGTSILFFTFDCPFLAVRITPAIPVVGGLMFIFVMSTFLRTSFSDPGVIPRATPDEAAYIERQIVPNNANSPTYRPPPRTMEIQVRGHVVKLKYCSTCKIFRPPRASHCSVCDNCVERFDHHCPWVGNCVGKRNYRHFYMFIISLTFLCVFIFACAVTHIILLIREDRQFIDAVKESPASVISGLVCFLSVWTILGLSGFHTYLTASNQTTNEDIKGVFTRRRGTEGYNPYSSSNVCANCLYVLCAPMTPSLIDRRGIVTPEYAAEREAEKLREQEVAAANNKTYGSVINMQPMANGGPHEGPNNVQFTQVNQAEHPQMQDQAAFQHFQMNQQLLQQQQQQQQQMHQLHQQQQLLLQQQQQQQHHQLQHEAQHERAQGQHSHQMSNSAQTPGSSKSLVVRPSAGPPTANGVEMRVLDHLASSETHTCDKDRSPGATLKPKPAHTGPADNMTLSPALDDLDLDMDVPVIGVPTRSLYSQGDVGVPLSASRLRLLQDTTMIESALDLDSLEDSSVGGGSTAGLLKLNRA